MTSLDDAALPVPQRLAVAYSPPSVRPAMLALLTFDRHLARLVAGTREPLAGQIRLAWWREELAKQAESRARGTPELEALGKSWRGEEPAVIELVEGWEHLLQEAPLATASFDAFANGRGSAFGGLARLAGEGRASAAAADAGRGWALADLLFRLSDETERETCRALWRRESRPPVRLPRALRGVAVLDGLARRAMLRDAPLMAGRGAALTALRLGLFGR